MKKLLSVMLLSASVVAAAVPALAASTVPTPPASATQANRSEATPGGNFMAGGGMMGGGMMASRGGRSGMRGPMIAMMRMMTTMRGASNGTGHRAGYPMMGGSPAGATGAQSRSH
jgi:hypothetical protein